MVDRLFLARDDEGQALLSLGLPHAHKAWIAALLLIYCSGVLLY